MQAIELRAWLVNFNEEVQQALTPALKNLHIQPLMAPAWLEAEAISQAELVLFYFDAKAEVPQRPELDTDEQVELATEPSEAEPENSDADEAPAAKPPATPLSFLTEGIEAFSQSLPKAPRLLLCNEPSYRELPEQILEQVDDILLWPTPQPLLEKRLSFVAKTLIAKYQRLIKQRQYKQQLQKKHQAVAQLQKRLNNSAHSMQENNTQITRMLSNLVLARMGQRASGRNQQLNLLMDEVAKRCEVSEENLKHLTYAWHLRNIGKLSFSDELLNKPYIRLNALEQRLFNSHPTLAHAAMMIVRPLDKAAKIVLQHKEYIDGSGYPNNLTEDELSLEAQILCILTDYTELVAGRYDDRIYSTEEALEYIDLKATERYNDQVTDVLKATLLELSQSGKGLHDRTLASVQLKAGMSLSRDLISSDGIVLLSEGTRFDRDTINRVCEMEMSLQEQFTLFIKQ